MADLSEEERKAYEEQYTQGLRKMRDFRIYTKDFVEEVEFISNVWPEKVVLLEHKIPEHCKRLDGMKTLFDQRMWDGAEERKDDIGRKVRDMRTLMQELENTLKIHFRTAYDRYYFTLMNTSF
ncbi:Oidioi.mRNA.OKI2018_I69.PAR.g13030.t1.cds [Oikopleura dioica]|uniref:Oidioi.mRNA.OKI2018_I69.PAR.g13030.t1.cds n=1 Tax=Oikopleura dioica TaxID=34765 RepID=A0ABN7S2S7_OIKDI|nr:Oidioi.mRNA.OKI2018_I69.PAR.g13030.t1.cds [Oikopleura dioica]